ncbi:MAG: class I SAM-dependent methyltransferase, partial [Thermoanaerobaculia bacterium]
MSENKEAQRTLEKTTGERFGRLWAPYDTALFEDSVGLFSRRLVASGFDTSWFRGKRCLDAGCGGGRNSVAMARLGASEVVGIDVGEEGIRNAQERASGLPNVRFQVGSLLDLPFADASFDLVWCAGVLMHTADEERALDELVRVLRPGGYLYLLVYATGGLRWPLIQWLRPLAAAIGESAVQDAMRDANLPANKRRTFLDDLFTPRIYFYDWVVVERMLRSRGMTRVERWDPETRFDHEESLAAYRGDLEDLLRLFSIDSWPDAVRPLAEASRDMVRR